MSTSMSMRGLPRRQPRQAIIAAAMLVASCAASLPLEPLEGIVAVSAPGEATCALHESGRVLCWGANTLGNLGDGTTTDRTHPTEVVRVTDAVQISGNWSRRCAVRATGRVLCWGGSGQDGELLGDGVADHGETCLAGGYDYPRTDCTPVPVAVAGLTDAAQVAVGWSHACALRQNGQVVCWGRNFRGSLGDGTRTDSVTPVAVVNLSDAIEVSVGESYACAVRATGNVVCWGASFGGTLGDGMNTDRDQPVEVVGLADAVAIAVGEYHACALHSAGTVACWGSNSLGQLGDGTTLSRWTPVEVIGLTDATQVSAGRFNTCVVRATGQAACWGYNSHGQVGDGTHTAESVPGALTPVEVVDLSDATRLSVGAYHAAAVRASGRVVSWGIGPLGDGTGVWAERHTPVDVMAVAD